MYKRPWEHRSVSTIFLANFFNYPATPFFFSPYHLVEMISRPLTFPIQALIALAVITLSLTSSVNASAAIAPARQFLFLDYVNRRRTTLLTSSLGFSRHSRPVSVSAQMMTRLNKARDFPNATLIATVNSCTSSTVDSNCLVQGGAFQACQDPGTGINQAGIVSCLGGKCPNTPFGILNCVVDPNQLKVQGTEIGILNPCTTDLQTDDITCLKSNFRLCALQNDNNNSPNTVAFGDCMATACTKVSSSDMQCIATNFGSMFTQSP
jgi:hypothetical protein